MKENILARLLSLPNWVFDFDGVVVDSSAIHANAFRKVFSEIGIDFDDYGAIAGRSTWDVVETQLRKAGRNPEPADVQELVLRKQNMIIDFIASGEGLQCPPGVREVIALGKRLGKTISMATSAARDRVLRMLDALELTAYFQCIVTADDVARGKPWPETYQAVLKHVEDDNAANYLVFEDSGSGVASAKAAGMIVIHYAAESWPIADADAAIASFEEVLAALETDGS